MPSPFMYHKIFMTFPVTYDIDLCKRQNNIMKLQNGKHRFVENFFLFCSCKKYQEKKIGNGSFNHLKAMANLLENFGPRSEIVIK